MHRCTSCSVSISLYPKLLFMWRPDKLRAEEIKTQSLKIQLLGLPGSNNYAYCLPLKVSKVEC